MNQSGCNCNNCIFWTDPRVSNQSDVIRQCNNYSSSEHGTETSYYEGCNKGVSVHADSASYFTMLHKLSQLTES